MAWTLRVRGPSGPVTLSGVLANSSLKDLQDLIADKTGVPSAAQEILAGYPPKPLQVPSDSAAVLLSSLPIANGDTLTVRQAEIPQAFPSVDSSMAQPPAIVGPPDMAGYDADLAAAIAASLADAQQPPAPPAQTRPTALQPAPSQPAQPGPAPTSMRMPDGSCVVRRIIDSDNSCLFNAVGYVMEHSRQKASELRQVIAGVVASDPETYNDAYLGKSNEEYCKWISQTDKWGGGIELAILATYYGRQIAAYDIQTKRCDLYGQGEGYTERAMVIYDGLHYDALAVSAFEGAPEDLDITILEADSPEGTIINETAEKLVAAAHGARQFTDIASFTLRCGACMIGLKGEKEAVEHAKATGHSNFTEY